MGYLYLCMLLIFFYPSDLWQLAVIFFTFTCRVAWHTDWMGYSSIVTCLDPSLRNTHFIRGDSYVHTNKLCLPYANWWNYYFAWYSTRSSFQNEHFFAYEFVTNLLILKFEPSAINQIFLFSLYERSLYFEYRYFKSSLLIAPSIAFLGTHTSALVLLMPKCNTNLSNRPLRTEAELMLTFKFTHML